MATISSPGIASGLDVTSIVSQLVALEKAPLATLQTQATSIQSKVSTYGTIKSQVSSLRDAAAKLATDSAWNAVSASSSDAASVGVTASNGAPTTSISMTVSNLAKAQGTASSAVATGSGVGTGTLSIEIGRWSGGVFTPGAAAAATSITIGAGEDSLNAIAAKINDAKAGVSATVLKDASGERLLLRSDATGEENGFRITTTDDDGNPNDAAGLSRLAYNPGTATGGMTLTQGAENAVATVNGVTITSASNTLGDSLQGLTLQLSKVTTTPVEISVKNDPEVARKNLQAFAEAYNTLNATMATATRYDATSKVAGPLQGDSTAVGLQNALRSMMRSVTGSSPFSRLADIGIEAKTGGALSIDTQKLDAALTNHEGLQALFTTTSTDATARGFGLKVRDFADGLLAVNGLVSTKTESLQSAFKRNGVEQERINDRAARSEKRLLAQYNAMDAAVGQLNGLSAFVSQQITMWNKSSG